MKNTNKKLKKMKDLQLHHPLFIKEVLICKLIYCLCNMNFPMCSYVTEMVISLGTDNLHWQSFCNIKVKWTRYRTQKLFL